MAETWPDGLNKLPVIIHTKECPRNADGGPEPKFTAEWMAQEPVDRYESTLSNLPTSTRESMLNGDWEINGDWSKLKPLPPHEDKPIPSDWKVIPPFHTEDIKEDFSYLTKSTVPSKP